MKKLKIKKEIFNEVLNKEVLDAFHNDINNKKYPINEDKSGLINFFYNLNVISLINNLLQSELYVEVTNHISDSHKLNMNLQNFHLKKCQRCNKNIFPTNQDCLVSSNVYDNYEEQFCICEQPKPNFNENVYYTNLNVMLFNWISSIALWERILYETIKLHIDFKEGKTIKVLDKTRVIFNLHSVFMNEYKTTENIKFSLYLIQFNDIIDEQLISESFMKKSKRSIINMQGNKEYFHNTLREILLLNNIKYKEDIFKEIGIISINETNLQSDWITDERNNTTHNFLISTNGNYHVMNLVHEELYIRLSIIMLYENIYFLYCILYVFDLLE